MADTVAGGTGHSFGGAGTFEGSGAVCRTSDRLAAEREFAKLRQVEKPTTRASQWIAEMKAEEAKKLADRAEKIRTGRLVVHSDGSYTEIL